MKEELSVSFWGFKLSSTNPGKKTFLLMGMLLLFFLGFAFVMKTWLLPTAGLLAGKSGLQAVLTAIRTRSP